MRKWVCILFLFGCTATVKKAARTAIRVYTLEELTAIVDSQADQIDSLKAMVVILDTSQWTVNNQQAKMKATDSLTVNYLMVQGPKKDTTGHNGTDTLIHAPN